VSGQTVSWSWSGGSASPGGMANIQYRYNINGGGWSGWSGTTSASRSGPGTYSIQVQAKNKAAEGPVASNGPHTIVQPAVVTLCFRGYNPSYYTVKFSGLSGGQHWFRIRDEGGWYGDSRTKSGSSGSVDTASFIYYTPPGDPDGDIIAWAVWSDSSGSGPWTEGTRVHVRDIPSC